MPLKSEPKNRDQIMRKKNERETVNLPNNMNSEQREKRKWSGEIFKEMRIFY